MATATMALPEAMKESLPFADKFWPKFNPVECPNCTEMYLHDHSLSLPFSSQILLGLAQEHH
jgi:hypothetical protein